ncbi:hypothetical protein [Rhizobium sp. BK176]|uniref:hypothetical protein n=1 Tax=Rhizobium sp. BK176 TaxID=2587071 RepID=UPI00216A538A|nr:hypothetical protein [Rhizobium sp. BK176]MCS4089573.1 hypothetical protein [Rhizobium sp. BK176]
MMIDAFLPNSPTGLLGFFTLISVIALVFGVVRVNTHTGPLVVGCGAIGLMTVGVTFFVFLHLDYQRNSFMETRAALMPVQEREFVQYCSRAGRIVDGATPATAPNCYDLDIYRVWTDGDRYYLGVVKGDRARIEAIFDRDGLIASDLNSIVFMDPDIDRDRIGFAFSRS